MLLPVRVALDQFSTEKKSTNRAKKGTAVVTVWGIAVAAAPDYRLAPEAASRGLPRLLPKAVVDLSRELAELAARDVRFERASTLAADLEDELTRLSGEPPPARARRRRARTRRAVRNQHTSERLQAFEAEVQALEETCQRIDEQGVTISTRQLSDLRLGERTRRVFHDAGLLYVQDVATLPAERAVAIPQLAPASVGEVRAAIMFAVETMGRIRQPILPQPAESGDLFDGLVQSVNLLPPREREVVVMRTGVGDRVYEVEEVARVLGCPAELVPQLERHALNTLLSQPASVEACWRLEELCARLGLGWDDERLPKVVAAGYPNTRASFTNLVAWLLREKGHLAAEAGGRPFATPRGIEHFEEIVVAALGRYGELSKEELSQHVHAALSPVDQAEYPDVDVPERVKLLGPAIETENATVRLPDEPVPGINDRHIRALNGLIGALQRLGSSRVSSLTSEVNRRLPRAYHVSDQYVRTWLTRHPELFTQSDSERYKLATLDIDILCGLSTSWMPGASAPAVAADRPGSVSVDRLHERVANEIADFLRRDGPQPISRIRAHLYGRFIGLGSADIVIAQNPLRFARDGAGAISVRDSDPRSDDMPDMSVATTAAPRRAPFWQHRERSPST